MISEVFYQGTVFNAGFHIQLKAFIERRDGIVEGVAGSRQIKRWTIGDLQTVFGAVGPLRGMARPDLGVRIPRSVNRRVSDEEVIGAIGREDSAILNFTGMMLEGIAMQEISEWISRCKERKTSAYRKYTRRMERAMGAYLDTVVLYWGDRMDVYRHYFDVALEECRRQRQVYLHYGMDNEVCRQLPPEVDREAALQLCFTIEMLRESEEVDREKMRRIGNAMGAPVRRDPDPNVREMIAACRDMQKDLRIGVEVTAPVRNTVTAFRTRLHCLCAAILEEEKPLRERQAEN